MIEKAKILNDADTQYLFNQLCQLRNQINSLLVLFTTYSVLSDEERLFDIDYNDDLPF